MRLRDLISQLREGYPEHKEPILFIRPYCYFVLIPSGRILAAVMIKSGLRNPNLVTIGGFIIGLAGLFLMYVGNYVWAILGTLLLNIWLVLDYTDGQVARYFGSSSKKGELLDDYLGIILQAFMFAALIPRCDMRILNDNLCVALSFSTGLLYIFGRYILERTTVVYNLEVGSRYLEVKRSVDASIKNVLYHINFEKVLVGLKQLLLRDIKWIALVIAVIFWL